MTKKDKSIYHMLKRIHSDMHWNYQYYGPTDMASYLHINVLLECVDDITFYYNSCSFEVQSIDSYLDFLFIYLAHKHNDLKPTIKPEFHEHFDQVMSKYAILFQSYRKNLRYIVDFINHSFDEILQYNNKEISLTSYNFLKATLSIINDFYEGFLNTIPSVVDSLIANKPIFLLDNYGMFQSFFKDSPKTISKLFSDRNIELFFDMRKDLLLDILSSLNNSERTNLFSNPLIQKVLEMISREIINPSDDMLYVIMTDTNTYIKFAANVKSKYYHIFVRQKKVLTPKFYDYLKKHGHERTGSIDISSVLTALDNGKARLEPFLYRLTHTYDEAVCISFARAILHPKEASVHFDLGRSNIETDDIFKLSVQEYLYEDIAYKSGVIINLLWNPHRLNTFYQYALKALFTISPDDEFLLDEWKNDMSLLYEFLSDAFSDQNALPNRNQIYAASGFCITLIEKILREYYISLNKDKYFNTDNITLMYLLQNIDDDYCITKLLGEDLQRVLIFCLCRTQDTRIGKNLRNKLFHWANLSSVILNTGLIGEVLYYLLMVINSLVSMAVKEEIAAEIDDDAHHP